MATDRNDSRLAAPGDLEVVRDFVNTLDVLPGTEEFEDSLSLASWLADHRLVPSPPMLTDEDLTRARSLREALRAFLVANAGFPLTPDVAEAFDDAVSSARLRAQADETAQLELLPTDTDGLDGAIGRLVVIVFAAQALRRDLVPPQSLRGVPVGFVRSHQEPLGCLVWLPVRRPGAL